MTLAYWCVLVAAYLPLVWTGLAKWSRHYDNAAPREYLSKTGGWRQRANSAQLNGFEAFPPFAAAVIIASLVHAPQTRIDRLAGAFIGLRILYGIAYLSGTATLRTILWMAATACVVALFITAAQTG